jgi:hypothetical protein
MALQCSSILFSFTLITLDKLIESIIASADVGMEFQPRIITVVTARGQHEREYFSSENNKTTTTLHNLTFVWHCTILSRYDITLITLDKLIEFRYTGL